MNEALTAAAPVVDPHCAVSRYPDARAVTRSLDQLISQPVYGLRAEALAEYEADYFAAKCSGSKELYEKACTAIPGGIEHNLAFNYPFPLAMARSEGAYLWDVDDNRYLDFLCSGGPNILGGNPPALREPIRAVLESAGPATGLLHEYEYLLADKICQLMPAVDKVRLLSTGNEASIAACRVARLATGKKNIVKMGGGYHGWSDQLSYSLRVPYSKSLMANGVPRYLHKHTQEYFPNDLNHLERVLRRNQLKGGTAAVFVEPVGPECGTRPIDRDHCAGVRSLCDKYGALLVFDEVVTAFRLDLHGAQGYFGVMPDLTMFGKVVGGGYPGAGGLGGREEVMRHLGAGLTDLKVKTALVAGTLAASALTCAAGYHTLCALEESDAIARAGALADRLTNGLQQLIAGLGLPYVAYNIGSIVHLQTIGAMHFVVPWSKPWTLPHFLQETGLRKQEMEYIGAAYEAEGLITLAGSRIYTNAAMTEQDIDRALLAFARVFSKVGEKH